MCNLELTIDLNNFTEDGYLKAKNLYIGASGGHPIKVYSLDVLRDFADPIINPLLLQEALKVKAELELSKISTPKEPEPIPIKYEKVELHDTKCGKCCFITCGTFNKEQKDCHCENYLVACKDCVHHDECF